MPSIKTALVTAAVLLSATVSGQRDYNIDPESVAIGTREGWCDTQIATCPILCSQTEQNSQSTVSNDCDPTTLSFSCLCANGISPNASEFSETLPYFKCRQYVEYCVLNCGGNSDCQYNCRADNPCGATNPTRVNLTSTTSSAVAGATANPSGRVYNGLGGDATATAGASNNNGGGGSSAGVMAIDLGRSYGLAIILTGVFAGFALVL